ETSAWYPPIDLAAFSYVRTRNGSPPEMAISSAYSERRASTVSFARGMSAILASGADLHSRPSSHSSSAFCVCSRFSAWSHPADPAALRGDLLRSADHLRDGFEPRGRGHADVHPRLRPGQQQRVSHVIAVADVRQHGTAQVPPPLANGQQVRQGLARVFEVRQ